MEARKRLNRGKIALTAGLATALAALGFASPLSPLSTASAQDGSRVCGMFWYTQAPDPANGDKLTWFTLGIAVEINKASEECQNSNIEKESPFDLWDFTRTYSNIPQALKEVRPWTHRGIDEMTCEDFATYVAKPPNGKEILDRGQAWPVDAADPCLSLERGKKYAFWFKHL